MSAANNQQAIREALAEIVNDHSTKFNNMGRVELLDRILSAIAPLLAPTPPVSTSAEKCASLCRGLFPELCTGLSDDQSEFMRKLVIVQRHFNGHGEDSARIDWLEKHGLWYGKPSRPLDDFRCRILLTTTTGIRTAIDAAMSAQTQG